MRSEQGCEQEPCGGLNVRVDGASGRPPLLSEPEQTAAKAIRARLNYFSPDEQILLLKAGYAQAEANIRLWYAPVAGLEPEPGTTPPLFETQARSKKSPA
jgi:hypothetical protein